MATQPPRKCLSCREVKPYAAFSMLYANGRRLRMSLVCIRCIGSAGFAPVYHVALRARL